MERFIKYWQMHNMMKEDLERLLHEPFTAVPAIDSGFIAVLGINPRMKSNKLNRNNLLYGYTSSLLRQTDN